MDVATLIGLMVGIALVGYAMLSGAGDQWLVFVNIPSAVMVIGGGIAAVTISFPLRNTIGVAKVIKKAFLFKPQDARQLIADLVRYAEVARRDGILALENRTKEIDDEFVVTGIQMAVDGTDPELIEQVLTSEVETLAERHAAGKAFFDALGKYAPAFGMIGTLVGLVIMLQNMDDPSRIGPGMAIALLTTLYGSMFANMFALPIADKLGVRSQEEVFLKMIVVKGVMAIQSGDNPRTVEQKLKTFLQPSQRQAQVEEG